MVAGLLVLCVALGVATASAAGTTTTTAPTSPTSVGSEYGVASFLFFLVIMVGGVWLWRRRAGLSR